MHFLLKWAYSISMLVSGKVCVFCFCFFVGQFFVDLNTIRFEDFDEGTYHTETTPLGFGDVLGAGCRGEDFFLPLLWDC